MKNALWWLTILTALASQTDCLAAGSITEYTHARWWDGSRFTEGQRYVRDGMFVAKPRGLPGSVVDLQDDFIVPPFGDAHNHMAGAPDVFNNDALNAGVFYFMNPNILASRAPALSSYLSRPDRIDAKLSMGGITAPGGHPEKLYQDTLIKYVYTNMKPEQMIGDAFHYVTRAEDIDPVLNLLVAQHAEFVKIMLLYSEEFEKRKDDPAYRGNKGLDPKLVPNIVAAAHKRGLRVAAHIETASDFRAIVASGVDEAAHMPGYVALEDPIDKYLITDADAAAAAKVHIVLVATASLGAFTRDADSRLPAVQAMQAENLKKLLKARVPLLIGTDGKVDGAIAETQYLVALGVMDPATALRILSTDTPRYIFPGRKIGRLAPGYEASFVALTADPSKDSNNLKSVGGYAKQGVLLKAPSARP
jgi:hypothetical protein